MGIELKNREEDKNLQEEVSLLKKLVEKQIETIKKQTSQIETLRSMNYGYLKEIERLKGEMRRLKKLKAKPKIRASKMDKGDKPDGGEGGTGKRPGSEKRSKRDGLKIDKIEVIEAKDVPVGSKFKGYKEYLVQGIEIQTSNCLFKLERWQLPDGSYRVAELPTNMVGHHFSCELRAYILHQYHNQGVTQPLLLSQLREWGIEISRGQLNRILTEDKKIFHEEKKEILASGLAVSDYIQVDDTGARHKGENGYCTHIGNELFAWFESTSSKSRINFLKLLMQGHPGYLIEEYGLDYMKKHKLAPNCVEKLERGPRVFENQESWYDHLNKLEITGEYSRRIATEGALMGNLLRHGFRTDIAILSDDAGQFDIFLHALCWLHAERKINELVPFGEAQIKAVEEKRNKFWELYDKLKEYKLAPNEISKQDIKKQFYELCLPNTYYPKLSKVLKKFMKDKEELLLVLDRPEIPLHNNLSENDLREYVKKRKISGSTRNDEGRKCRDTFTSLKKTCRKLNIRFWDYLLDRLRMEGNIPPLSTLIEQKAIAC